MVKVVTPVDAPRPTVFSVLTNFPAYTDWIPGCEKCNVLKSAENSAEIEIVLRAMKVMTMQLRFDWDADQAIRFVMIKGSDLKAYSGNYRLMDAANGSGSVLITELDLNAGAMAPKFLVDRMIKDSLDKTGQALGKRVREVPQVVPATPVAKPEKPAGPVRRHARTLLRIIRGGNGVIVWYGGTRFHPDRNN